MITLVFAALLLAACNPGADDRADEVAPASSISPASLLPVSLEPADEKGEKGARNLLLGFARALENRQFTTAFALLGGFARGDRSEAEFAAQWSGLQGISVALVDGEVEGGAGSLFYSAQTTITATGADGRPVRFEGPIMLRRVNDVDGASDAQLRWHLESFNVAQVN